MHGAGRDGIAYGLLCFAAGFAFGALREVLLVPALGRELGYWVEFPLVTMAVIAIAYWLVHRSPDCPAIPWLVAGALGVATLLVLESGLALLVLGVPVQAYLETFDVTRGALFPIGLGVMLVAPAGFAALIRGRGPK
jgi:fermentation-respiration switch protein FrsA (DUF1100 family)